MDNLESAKDIAAKDAGVVDGEHEVLLGLLKSLEKIAKTGKKKDRAGDLLDQLATYAEVHFMSENLLMRLYEYPDYDDHAGELLAHVFNILDCELLVNLAAAVPAYHLVVEAVRCRVLAGLRLRC